MANANMSKHQLLDYIDDLESECVAPPRLAAIWNDVTSAATNATPITHARTAIAPSASPKT